MVYLKIVREDISTDLVALRADEELPALPFRLRPDSARPGERVSIVGFPIPDVLGISPATRVYGTVENYDASPRGNLRFLGHGPSGTREQWGT